MTDAKETVGRRTKGPDPLGKRLLFGVSRDPHSEAIPQGRPSLFSEPEIDGARHKPPVDGGPITVGCSRCHVVAKIGWLDFVIFSFPMFVWFPRGPFDHRITCPSCRKRSWVSVSLKGQ